MPIRMHGTMNCMGHDKFLRAFHYNETLVLLWPCGLGPGSQWALNFSVLPYLHERSILHYGRLSYLPTVLALSFGISRTCWNKGMYILKSWKWATPAIIIFSDRAKKKAGFYPVMHREQSQTSPAQHIIADTKSLVYTAITHPPLHSPFPCMPYLLREEG